MSSPKIREAPASPLAAGRGVVTARLLSHGIARHVGRCSGRPVIAGTRIWTSAVMDLFVTGASLEVTAWLYMVTPGQVEDAIRFECCLREGTPWAVEFARKRLRRGT